MLHLLEEFLLSLMLPVNNLFVHFSIFPIYYTLILSLLRVVQLWRSYIEIRDFIFDVVGGVHRVGAWPELVASAFLI